MCAFGAYVGCSVVVAVLWRLSFRLASSSAVNSHEALIAEWRDLNFRA